MKVTLAIPNYNGSENIENILSQAAHEDFDTIYFLDDASTDNSLKIAEKFPEVKIIKGSKNIGPAGNRNWVLGEKLDDIVMFLDVDMVFQTTNIKSKITEMFSQKDIVLVGGQIFSKQEEPMWWNYGPEMHPIQNAKSEVVHDWLLDVWEDMEKVEVLKEKYTDITPNFEISFGKIAEPKEVDWVSEANFCVRTEVFQNVGGFDKNMRYHADQDLCKRIRQLGHKILFSPEIKTKHLEIDTFGKDRSYIMRESAFYFYKKHWGMAKEIFDKLYPEK